MERLHRRDAEHLRYEASEAGPGGCGAQILTPLQLIDCLAAWAPRRVPRLHHRPAPPCATSSSPSVSLVVDRGIEGAE
ncbi:MAG: hypothetical protein IT516_17835 [Burkholderiales bacterium]|nr:hypothetical protein [Burkholderiales bacterium]